MSWLFSRALVEEYSAVICSDGEPYAQLNVMPTPHKFWRNDKTMEFSDLSRFGLTSRLLTEDHGEAVLMSYLQDFPVRTLAPQVKASALVGNEADYGFKLNASFAKYDPVKCGWKTRQCSLVADWDEFSETWPSWGLMLDGESCQQPALGPIMSAKGSGYMPTPTTGCTKIIGLANRWDSTGGSGARKALAKLGMSKEEMAQQRNPEYLEWQMMWPLGWTEVKPLETAKFQEWLQQHGGF